MVVVKLSLELPTLYGDHHVSEVRRLLQALPGVKDIYASSCFHLLEVQYDPAQVEEEAIVARLEEAGYLGELPAAQETGISAYGVQQGAGEPAFFRHTTMYETVRQSVSFTQKVDGEAERRRPMWPCPGMGAVSSRSSGEGEN
jgi:copper chaperone CopZ